MEFHNSAKMSIIWVCLREVAKKVIFLMAVPLRDGWGGGVNRLPLRRKKIAASLIYIECIIVRIRK